MPVKLNYSIIACTGEDPEGPASELLYPGPDSKGWCTPRFCQYPQELTLRLEVPARLTKIQLLSHEYMIAGKVELLVGYFEGAAPGSAGGGGQPSGADLSKATWRRLGSFAFLTNEASNYGGRELKSIGLDGVPAQLMRVIIHRCHANPLNVHGQVSLVAIDLIGEPLAPFPLAAITNTGGPFSFAGGALPLQGLPGQLPTGALQHSAPPYMPAQLPLQQTQQFLHAPQMQAPQPPGPPSREASSAAALAAELGVDSVTAHRIFDLQQQKQQAVEREDYDEAKRLKAAVDRLRAAGGAIAQLEARKRGAVEEEDYDLAKQLKQEIDRMRAAAYAAALSSSSAPDTFSPPFSPPHSRRGSAVGGPHAASAAGQRLLDAGGRQPGGPAAGQHDAGAAEGRENASPAARRRSEPPALSPSGSEWTAHDERPAQAKGAYSFHNADESSLPATNRRSSMPGAAAGGVRASASHANDAGPAPPGFPSDLAPPEALSAAAAKDAGQLVELAGEYLARCAFSRTWQLREAALAHLAKQLEGGALECGSDTARTISGLLQRTLKDKVAAVYSASLATLRALVAAQASRGSPRDLQAVVGELLPVLTEKAADLNQRTREQATETLVALAEVPEAGLKAATAPFLRAPKPNAAWKIVQGRLQLVAALLPAIGIAPPGSNDGFQLESLMAFVGPALSNSSAEVRGAAVALVVQVALLAGPSVQRMLPGDLNPKIKEQIEQGMLGGGTVSPGNGSTAKPSPAAARATAAPAAARPQQTAAAPAPGRQNGQRQQQPAAAQSPAQQHQQQQQAGAVQPAATPLPADDPAVYEAQVRAREAQLGPSHPDVAEAICNLAIVHNQRGDIAKALPLYQRALAIWEATRGPDSPDVAHTLTDIAVIHLEQGRDDIGRPLLQRALRIQEAHLGPHHPDVIAIRDVLDEEEGGSP